MGKWNLAHSTSTFIHKDSGPNSRKRKADAPKETGGKKRKTEIKIPKQATAQTSVGKKKTQSTVTQQKNGGIKKPPAKGARPEKKTGVVLKEGVPKDGELEALGKDISDKWMNLGRRLNIEDAKLQAIAKDVDSLNERGFQMLKHWKQKQGSGANYKALSDALKHNLMERKDLAEKYCFKRQYSKV